MTDTSTPTVWAGLSYADAPAAIQFLTKAFGFVEKLVVPGAGDREIAHAELRWPDGSGGVMLGTVRDKDDPFYIQPGKASVYVVTSEPDALFARAVAAGAEVVSEPKDAEGHESRDFSVRDPEGNAWNFGTYPGA
ncbi:VOC family protein [Flindersiella endophytica]